MCWLWFVWAFLWILNNTELRLLDDDGDDDYDDDGDDEYDDDGDDDDNDDDKPQHTQPQ